MTGLESIPKRRDFVLASSNGHRLAVPGLVLQKRDRGDQDKARLGITASKKIGNAVARNRAKRRLRALASECLSYQSRQGHDYVLIARYNTNSLSWLELTHGLNKALAKLDQCHTSLADADTDANTGAKRLGRDNAKTASKSSKQAKQNETDS